MMFDDYDTNSDPSNHGPARVGTIMKTIGFPLMAVGLLWKALWWLAFPSVALVIAGILFEYNARAKETELRHSPNVFRKRG